MIISLQSFLENIMLVGSANYYAFKKIPQNKLQRVLVIFAFYEQIETILLTCNDYSVAHTKLNWWRHELVKMSEHPISLALRNINVKKEILLELIDNLEEPLHALP